MSRILLVALVLLAAGCATGTPLWITNDYDPAQDPRRFERDRYECRRDATSPGGVAWTVFPIGVGLVPIPLYGGPDLNADLFAACMNAKGYTLRWQEAPSPSTGPKDGCPPGEHWKSLYQWCTSDPR